MRPGALITESGSLSYQRVEKPAQIVRERLSLNEYCTAISTGTIAHSMYAQVISDEEPRPAPRVGDPASRMRPKSARALPAWRRSPRHAALLPGRPARP